MAANLTTFFTRIGQLMDMAEAVRTHQANIEAKLALVVAEYSSADMHYISQLVNNLNRHKDDAGKIFADIRAGVHKTLLETFDEDLITANGGGLDGKNVPLALAELIRQMVSQSKTIERSTQSIGSTSAVDGTGNGTMVMTDLAPIRETSSTLTPYFQTIKKELIRATCIADSTDRRIAPMNEEFLVQGQRAEPRGSHEWPKGSGINHVCRVTSPKIDNGQRPGDNVLANSDFEEWTSNVPDAWTLVTGSAGTHIVKDSTYEATGTNCLRLDNDGSTLTTIKQTIDDPSGTLGKIYPDRPYVISASVRKVGTVSAGVLAITIKDSGGTILNNGSALHECSLSVAHGDFTTSHVRKSNICFMPLNIGSGAYVEIKTTTAFTNNSDIIIDDLVITELHRPLAGGVAFALLPGATNFVYNDQMTVAVSNNYGGEFATEFDRYFNTEALGVALPDSGSANIADSLIG